MLQTRQVLDVYQQLEVSKSGLITPGAIAGGSSANQVMTLLGAAGTFGVLAGSTTTNTGTTTIQGDVGVSPGTSITGYNTATITGAFHSADTVAANAQLGLTAAYNYAASQISTGAIVADLGGQTLTPGVYTTASGIGITGTLTLNAQGNPNAIWIFQAGSTLTTASNNSNIVLTGGAQAGNVYWQVGSSATLNGGATSNFIGTILALTSISVSAVSPAINGRLLARNGAVTLITTTLTQPTSTSSASGTVSSGSFNILVPFYVGNGSTQSPAIFPATFALGDDLKIIGPASALLNGIRMGGSVSPIPGSAYVTWVNGTGTAITPVAASYTAIAIRINPELL